MAPKVVIEFVGDEALVLAPGLTEAYRLKPELARVVRAVQLGDVVPEKSSEVSQLVDLGILERVESGMSRRSVLTGAATAAGGAAIALAMPGVAAASSEPNSSDDGDPFTINGTYTPDGTTFGGGTGTQTFKISTSDAEDDLSGEVLQIQPGNQGGPLSETGGEWTVSVVNVKFSGTQTGLVSGFNSEGRFTYTVTFTPV